MAERDHRHVDPDERRHLPGVHAGGVDDDLAFDPPLVRFDRGDAPVRRLDPGDLRADLDLRPEAARAVGERKRELRGIQVAVFGDERGAEHAVRRHRRKHRLGLLRGDDLHRQAEGPRP